MAALKGAPSFERLFGESVAAGLASILGKSGAEATLKHMGLGPFPTDPVAVESGLVAIFKRSGAQAIERQILKALFAAMSERFLDDDRKEFPAMVEMVKQKFMPAAGGGGAP
jgi:hypothetical protein